MWTRKSHKDDRDDDAASTISKSSRRRDKDKDRESSNSKDRNSEPPPPASSSSSSKRRSESMVSSSTPRTQERREERREPRERNTYPTPTAPSEVGSERTYATASSSTEQGRVRGAAGDGMGWDVPAKAISGGDVDGPRSRSERKERRYRDEREESRERKERAARKEEKKMRREREGSRDRDDDKRERERERRRESKRGIDDDEEKKKRKSRSEDEYGTTRADPTSAVRPERTDSYHAPHLSAQISSQFPGQDPSNFEPSAFDNPFGAAADYYADQGESVHHQPGVRPLTPNLTANADPHLAAPSASPHPVQDTGAGAAAEFYGAPIMPGGFTEEPAPMKPSRPSEAKPSKPGKLSSSSKHDSAGVGSAATMAAGAALGYALGHGGNASQSSSMNVYDGSYATSSYHQQHQQQSANVSSSYHVANASGYGLGGSSSAPQIPTLGSYAASIPSSHRPSKKEKDKKHAHGKNPSYSADSHTAGYATAAGLAAGAYGIHEYDKHKHDHKHERPGYEHQNSSYTTATNVGAGNAGGYASRPSRPSNNNIPSNNAFPSNQHQSRPSPYYIAGGSYYGPSGLGMQQRQQHKGPLGKLSDWWKDYEDVRKMEEYTEYIGVCRGCFEEGSGLGDAPRQHHYHGRGQGKRKRRDGEGYRMRSSESVNRVGLGGAAGRVDKENRYGSEAEKRRRSHKDSRSGLLAATGLGGYAAVKAAKRLLGADERRFNDTYSVKSGRYARRSSGSSTSSSSSSDGKSRRTGTSRGVVGRTRSHRSHDGSVVDVRLSSAGARASGKDHEIVRKHGDGKGVARSRSSSRDRKSRGTATKRSDFLAPSTVAAALGASLVSGRSRSHSRTRGPSRSPARHGYGYGYAGGGADVRRHHRDHSPQYDHSTRHRSSRPGARAETASSSAAGLVAGVLGATALGGLFSSAGDRDNEKTGQRGGKEGKHVRSKKPRGFFSFGNNSSSSSVDTNLAYGAGLRRRSSASLKGQRRPQRSPERRGAVKRKSSEEKLSATLAGIAGTAAALSAAQAGRDGRGSGAGGRVVAVRDRKGKEPVRRREDMPYPEHYHQQRHRRGNGLRSPSSSSVSSSDDGDEGGEAGVWEDLPSSDAESSVVSFDSGLAYGGSSRLSRKSTESLKSEGSGTGKWGWRWGFGGGKGKKDKNKDKGRKSGSGNSHGFPELPARADAGGGVDLNHNVPPSSASFAGPSIAATNPASAGGLSRHSTRQSSTSSIPQPPMRTAYPYSTGDPNTFDAVKRASQDSFPPPTEPIYSASRPSVAPLQQPQPEKRVSGDLYTNAERMGSIPAWVPSPSLPTYDEAPTGPPVFSGTSSPQTMRGGRHQSIGPGPAVDRYMMAGALPPSSPIDEVYGRDKDEGKDEEQRRKRRNSSPTPGHDSWVRDAAITGFGAAAAAGAIGLLYNRDKDRKDERAERGARPAASPSRVSFDLPKSERDVIREKRQRREREEEEEARQHDLLEERGRLRREEEERQQQQRRKDAEALELKAQALRAQELARKRGEMEEMARAARVRQEAEELEERERRATEREDREREDRERREWERQKEREEKGKRDAEMQWQRQREEEEARWEVERQAEDLRAKQAEAERLMQEQRRLEDVARLKEEEVRAEAERTMMVMRGEDAQKVEPSFTSETDLDA
ncbi:hypothetical protein LTS18_004833, partial [Coniosporium uncinatum]